MTASRILRPGLLALLLLIRPDSSPVAFASCEISFGTPIPFATGKNPRGIVVADFNRDGFDDVAVANTDLTGNGIDGSVSVLHGGPVPNGQDPTLETRQSIALAGKPFDIASADFNHDGALDLAVVLNSSRQVAVLLGEMVKGSALGRFSAPVLIAAGEAPVDVAAADFDSDGKPDLAVVNNTCIGGLSLLRGRGDGTFDPPVRKDTACLPTQVAIGDFNSDGHPDAAMTGTTDYFIHVLPGTGTGGFGGVTRLETQGAPGGIAAADMNGDRILDLIVACNRIGTKTLLIFKGNGQSGRGDGTFSASQAFDLKNLFSVVADDVNSDGALDLACTGVSTASPIYLFRGEHKGAVVNENLLAVDRSDPVGASLSIAAGDLNGDGVRELVASVFEAGVVVLPVRCGESESDGTPQIVARWRKNGIPIARAADEQSRVQVVRDGFGGAIFAWQDRRNGAGYDIYAQRLSSSGDALWGPNGHLVSGGPGNQLIPMIVPDDAGGAFVAWTDDRSGRNRVKLQHLTSNGVPAPGSWPAEGFEHFSGKQGFVWDPRLQPDGTGGVYLVALDYLFDNGLTSRLTCARFMANGAMSAGWPATGLTLGTASVFFNPDVNWSQIGPFGVATEPAAGVAITFTLTAYGRSSSRSVQYVASVRPSGSVSWTTHPDRALDVDYGPAALTVPDRQGGAFLFRQGPRLQVSTYRSNGLSDPPLDFGPPAGGGQLILTLQDGSDGAFVNWHVPSGSGGSHFLTRVSAGGRIADGWASSGIPIVEGNWGKSGMSCVQEHDDGLLFCWGDGRGYDADLYVTRRGLDGSLTPGWKQNGTPIVEAPTDQLGASMDVVDSHTIVIAWTDWRSGAPDVYAQCFTVDPSPAAPEVPRTGGDQAEIEVILPSVVHSRTLQMTIVSPERTPFEVALLDIQGRILERSTVHASSSGRTRVQLDLSARVPGLYWARIHQGKRAAQRRIVSLR